MKQIFISIILIFIINISSSTTHNNNNKNNNNNNNNTTQQSNNRQDLLHAVFWELKPFIFTNEDGNIEGIIPHIFEQASVFCNARKPFIKYVTRVESRQKFFQLSRSNISYGEGVLSGVDQKRAFWAPVLSPTHAKNDGFLEKKKLRSFQLMKTQYISVIVRRDLISLPNKILRGIMACEQIFVIAILIAIIVGIILWIIERFRNNDFPKSFSKGALTGLYWSIVSMTTVGYGDIQPVTAIGRFVTCFWLFIGVMVGCVMTATVTDVVAGNDFSIQNKKVAVLENSFEHRTAEKQYRAHVVTAQSYEEVLQLVRQQKVYAAMMNSDVAAWHNDQISDDQMDNPLRMVKKLPANLYVHCFLPIDLLDQVKRIFKCMYYQKDEVYTFAEESYRVHHHPETIYIGSTGDLMSQNAFVRGIVGILVALISVGLVYDGWKYWITKHDYDKGGDDDKKGVEIREKISKVKQFRNGAKQCLI